MRPVVGNLTAEQLREALEYDPETGEFYRRYPAGRARTGDTAGRINNDGYRRIGVGGEYHCAHRLAWLYVHGEWPSTDVDHINHVRADNRIANLRLATRSQNVHYTRISKRNTSGFRGVHYARADRKWNAQIKINGKGIHLGSFDCPEHASIAYQAASKVHFKQFAYSPDNASDGPGQIPQPIISRQCPVGVFEALLLGANPSKLWYGQPTPRAPQLFQ